MSTVFESMLNQGRLPMLRPSWIQQDPPPLQPDPDRVEGVLWGLVIGDALGRPLEARPPAERGAEVSEYAAGGARLSDDSLMALWTLEHLLEHGRIKPKELARRFAAEPIPGAGRTIREFVRRVQAGMPWYECAPESAGNGALMRIAPVLVPHLQNPSPQLWADTALSAVVTHRDGSSVAACLAYVRLLWELLRQPSPPPPGFYLDTFLTALETVEPDGRLAEHTRRLVGEAWRADLPARAAIDRWRSGAYLFETVPCLLYLLMQHARDPRQAVIRAVNDCWDADTLGALVGAAVGAVHGRSAFPQAWVDGLRDPRLELISRAKRRWFPGGWDGVVDRLGGLRLGEPASYGQLHLVPLLGPPGEGPDVLGLEEALRSRSLRVREVNQVQALELHNRGRRQVLLLEGEELVGGRQNRVLNTHILLQPGQQVRAPVSCVEQGRWGAQRAFEAGRQRLSARARAQHTRVASRNGYASNQEQIWEHVQGQLRRTRASSATHAMSAAFTQQRARVETLLRQVPACEGQVGVLALLGDKVLGLEVFATAVLYARAHDKLLTGFFMDAVGTATRPLRASRREQAQAFLTRLAALPEPALYAAIGSGRQLRFDHHGLVGSALLEQDRLVCLSAFPA